MVLILKMSIVLDHATVYYEDLNVEVHFISSQHIKFPGFYAYINMLILKKIKKYKHKIKPENKYINI